MFIRRGPGLFNNAHNVTLTPILISERTLGNGQCFNQFLNTFSYYAEISSTFSLILCRILRYMSCIGNVTFIKNMIELFGIASDSPDDVCDLFDFNEICICLYFANVTSEKMFTISYIQLHAIISTQNTNEYLNFGIQFLALFLPFNRDA